MRHIFFILSLALLVLPSLKVEAGEVEKSAIVQVYTTANPYNFRQPWALGEQESRTGSGVIISGQRILTNAHVVADHTVIQVRRAGQADKFPAELEAVSQAQDLAILRVPDKAFFSGATNLKVGSLPDPGTPVVTYGFPEGGTRITVTEGVLSRIDHGTYAHSGIEDLLCQIDASINNGSSGGPVIAAGEFVGLAFQAMEDGENIAYMIPAPVIRQFLTDLEDGHYDGAPDLPYNYQDMENPALRAACGMDNTQSGILLTAVPDFLRGTDKLLPGDVLMSIGGYPVANDGTVEFRSGQRVTADYVVEQMQIGQSVALELFRNGKKVTVKVRLDFAKVPENYLVPGDLHDVVPQYYVIGGLVFAPLTSNYLQAGIDAEDLPLRLFRYIQDGWVAKTKGQSQVVALIDVLSDEVNAGYETQGNDVVREVNGRRITSMKDLVAAFEDNWDGDFHKIVLGRPESGPSYIVLSGKKVRERDQAILQRYKVPAKASPDLLENVTPRVSTN